MFILVFSFLPILYIRLKFRRIYENINKLQDVRSYTDFLSMCLIYKIFRGKFDFWFLLSFL